MLPNGRFQLGASALFERARIVRSSGRPTETGTESAMAPSAKTPGPYEYEEDAFPHARRPQRLPLQHGKKSGRQVLCSNPGFLPSSRLESRGFLPCIIL